MSALVAQRQQEFKVVAGVHRVRELLGRDLRRSDGAAGKRIRVRISFALVTPLEEGADQEPRRRSGPRRALRAERAQGWSGTPRRCRLGVLSRSRWSPPLERAPQVGADSEGGTLRFLWRILRGPTTSRGSAVGAISRSGWSAR